jgi:hypothetical protein
MVDWRVFAHFNHEMGMRIHLLVVFTLQLLFAGIATCKENTIAESISEIKLAPDWRTLRFPDRTGGSKVLIETLLKHVKYNQEEFRRIIRGLAVEAELNQDLAIGGKIYILNRLYCNVPNHSKRDDWKVFGGWGGIGVDEDTLSSLYPIVLKDGEFTLEQFSGYAGPPYRGLEEFDWLLKRFGQRFNNDSSESGKNLEK